MPRSPAARAKGKKFYPGEKVESTYQKHADGSPKMVSAARQASLLNNPAMIRFINEQPEGTPFQAAPRKGSPEYKAAMKAIKGARVARARDKKVRSRSGSPSASGKTKRKRPKSPRKRSRSPSKSTRR